mmetsp:Transcript_19224/g.45853  ORF Transcript_19224/g.45853 Transcript_19224/m.45853 type:complete len:325 (+) Transcript_19224:252-1226(+)
MNKILSSGDDLSLSTEVLLAPGLYEDQPPQLDVLHCGQNTIVARKSMQIHGKYATLALLCLLSGLVYSDQSILAPNLTAMGESFGLRPHQTDTLAGDISAGIWFVGAPSALLAGWLVDRLSRRWLLFLVVLLAELPSCLTIMLITHPWQLIALRCCTGLAVGASVPIMYSLLADMFPPSARAGIAALLPVAQGAGMAMGQVLGSAIGTLAGWRLPYLIVPLMATLVAGLFACITRDPPRGGTEEALQAGCTYEERMSWSKLQLMFSTPTNVLIVIQGLPGCLPWGVLVVFLNDYLVQQKGLSAQVAPSRSAQEGFGPFHRREWS